MSDPFFEKTVLGSSTDPTENADVLDGNLPVSGEVRLRNEDGTDHADPVNGLLPVSVSMADSPSVDAFGRLRTSDTYTIFDSKQLYDSLPLIWDDQETSGSGTSSAYRTNEASTRISVGATTAGVRIRQTFMRFTYQPGKSQRILATCSNLEALSGNTKGFGYGDENNGLFLVSDGGTLKFIRRTYVTGTAVDNEEVISTTLPNGTVMDLTKTMILDIDFEWLGVGRVRAGYVDGVDIQYFYTFTGVNNLDVVYMSTPNLPLRYWIENDGTGAADLFDHICAAVMSEGGQEANGLLRYISTKGVHLNANAADTLYAAIGLRLKSTHIGTSIDQVAMSIISETNDDFEWVLVFNPTVAGTFTYSGLTNSACEYALGATVNTVSGGFEMSGGMSKSSSSANQPLENAIRLGSAIDGTVDEIALCVRPLSSNADIQSAMTWRELS